MLRNFLMVGFCLLMLVLGGGCASATILKAETGAKIYVDGRYVGEESAFYSDKKVIGSFTVVEVKKPGFKDKVAIINRSGEINTPALVGGILLAPTVVGLLFFLWVMDYRPYYVFDLEPESKLARNSFIGNHPVNHEVK
ncbi:MAG: hypothetical protein KC505_00385 [Myxococcales bacterium]|nr:hypothetical protein [Myxococcales bacterium]USN51798.1 MAG: hypothetical protein H6731_05170 [Myxococcales bacterium]